jgi:serine/threonine protein kinase
MNLPFVLHAHLNHPTQQSILSTLLQCEQSQYHTDSELGASTLRLLRLLCCSYFNPEQYVDKVRIGMGRFGKVYVAQQQLTQQKVAVKWLDVPRNLEEDCVIFDLYSELTIMEQLKFQHNMVQMLEYGVDKGAYWVVMDYYPSSLRSWRTSLGKIDHDALNDSPASTSNLPLPSSQLRLCLSLFGRILQAMHTMQQLGIVHYDIKADNILIVPPENAIQGIEPDATQFRLSFADFGQSSMQTSAIAAVFASLNPSNQNGNNQSAGDSFNSQLTWIGRGTENIQAPEMLSLSRQLNKQAVNFDRRKQSAVDGRADIWSLGCLFFELLTGEFLFEDDARSCLPFVLRVVDEEQPLITKEQEAMLGHNTHLIAFLRSVIVRQRFLRPSLADVQRRFESMCHALFPTMNSSSAAKSDDTIPVWFKYLESDDKKQTIGDKPNKKDAIDDTWVWGNNIHEPVNEEHEFQAVHSLFHSVRTPQHDSFDPKIEELRTLFQEFDASLAKCQVDIPIESAPVSHHAARLQPEPVPASAAIASTTSSIVGDRAKSIVHVTSNLLIGSSYSLAVFHIGCISSTSAFRFNRLAVECIVTH